MRSIATLSCRSFASPMSARTRRRRWRTIVHHSFPPSSSRPSCSLRARRVRPCPYRKTWGRLVACVRGAAAALGLPAGAALIGTVPAQHMYGFESTVLLALLTGNAFMAARPFYPADVRVAIDAPPRPRVLITTPVHLRTVLADDLELPPLDLIVSATAPLSQELAREAERRFGAPLLEIYGSTETGQIAVRHTAECVPFTLLPGVRLRADNGQTYAYGGHVEQMTALCDVLEQSGDDEFHSAWPYGGPGQHCRQAQLLRLPQRPAQRHSGRTGRRVLPARKRSRRHYRHPAPGGRRRRSDAFGRNAHEASAAPHRSRVPAAAAGDRRAAAAQRHRQAATASSAGARRPPAASHGTDGDSAALAQKPVLKAARTFTVPADHPAFAGHFPGMPVLPGAALLDEALHVLEEDSRSTRSNGGSRRPSFWSRCARAMCSWWSIPRARM